MKTFNVITLLLGLASAAPVNLTEKDVAILDNRYTQMIYLANCDDSVSCCRPTEHTSEIIYYPDGEPNPTAQSGVPDPNNVCTVSSNGYVDWLNTSPSCTFPTGVTFWSHVDQGWGNNGYDDWDCYADPNYSLIYTDSQPEREKTCYSPYYCTLKSP